MNITQGFLAAFFYLDYLLTNEFTDNDYMIDIVSDMDPYIWQNADGTRGPADIATGSDWQNIIQNMSIQDNAILTPIQVFDIMIKYLEFHHKEFDFIITAEIEKLKAIQQDTTKQYHQGSCLRIAV